MAGLYPKEAAVMKLWVAGFNVGVIALNTQLTKRSVQRIVSKFHHIGDADHHRAMMRRGSAHLLAAILIARAA